MVALLAAVSVLAAFSIVYLSPSSDTAWACPASSPAQPTLAPGYPEKVLDAMFKAGLGKHMSMWGTDNDHYLFVRVDTEQAKAVADCVLIRLGVPAQDVPVTVQPFIPLTTRILHP
jgi:hypothetical protein